MIHRLPRQVTSPDSTNIKHLLCQALCSTLHTQKGGDVEWWLPRAGGGENREAMCKEYSESGMMKSAGDG